jgi:hypothetical protein
MSEGNKVVTRRVIEEVFNEGSLDRAAGLGLVLLLVFVLMAALLVMVLPGTANAKKHHHRAAPVASAYGQGVASDNEPFKFYVKTYKSYPNDAATGTFLVRKGAKDFVQGKLTCFRYGKAPDGTRRANFAGPITKTNLPDHHFGAFWVTDSGKPNGVGDLYNAFNAPTAKCTSWNRDGTEPLKSGNVVVNTVRTIGVSENTSSPKQMNEGAVGLFDDLPG